MNSVYMLQSDPCLVREQAGPPRTLWTWIFTKTFEIGLIERWEGLPIRLPLSSTQTLRPNCSQINKEQAHCELLIFDQRTMAFSWPIWLELCVRWSKSTGKVVDMRTLH